MFDGEELVSVGEGDAGEGYQPGAEGAGDGSGVSLETDGDFVELDGERVPVDQVREALDALKNRSDWEGDFKRRDQQFAAVRKAVEQAFDKQFKDFSRTDLDDLRAFGLFNTRLRSDPDFAKSWEQALIAAYKGEGMTAKDARAEAKQDVKDIKATGEIPPDVAERLKKVDQLEARLAQRDTEETLGALESHVDKVITSTVARTAADLPAWGDFIKRHVLYGLIGNSDTELMQMAEDGSLIRTVGELTKQAVKLVKTHEQTSLATKTEALKGKKAGVTPVPGKGGVGAETAQDAEAPRPGRGLAGMHNRMRATLEAMRREE